MHTGQLLELAAELTNPDSHGRCGPDSCVCVQHDDLHTVLVCIDCDAAELMLAKQLGADAVVAHHPVGGEALVGAHRSLDRLAEMLVAEGVGRGRAAAVVDSIKAYHRHNNHSKNFARLPAIARQLGLGLVNIYLPCEQLGRQLLVSVCGRITAEQHLAELLDELRKIPQLAAEPNELRLACGSESRKVGRCAVLYGHGTGANFAAADALYDAGVRTVVCSHIAWPELIKLRASGKGNLIITGHLATDAIGMERFATELQRRYNLQVLRVGLP